MLFPIEFFEFKQSPHEKNSNYKQKHKMRFSPEFFTLIPQKKIQLTGKSIFLIPCLRAGATVEATLIMPVILSFFLFFYRVIFIILIHSMMGAEVYDIGNKIVTYSYENETEPTDYFLKDAEVKAMAEALMRKKVSESFYKDRITELTCSLSGRNRATDEIEVVAVYKIKSTIDFFSKKGIRLTNRFHGRLFTGFKNTNEDTEYVYITKGSEVYHKSPDCRAINVEVFSISKEALPKKRNKSGGKYYKCTQCRDKGDGTVFYITEYGNKYHTNHDCYEINKSAYRVPMREVEDRRLCFYCR